MKSRLHSILACLALTGASFGQPTALTYQGRLKNGGQPASGLHDFRFRLFDAAQGGTQLGDLICVNNVTVTDGLFTTSIDFGQQFASPDARFLEIQVREDAGQGCGNGAGFVTLNPRQAMTPAPLAAHANSAFALDAADGGPEGAVFVDAEGEVGIGTTTPAGPLHVASDAFAVLILQDPGPADQQAGYVGFWNGNPSETGWMGFGTPGSPHMTIVNARNGGNLSLAAANAIGLTLVPSGSIGIGTVSPQSTLDVRGDIRLGASGEFRAASGDENLRIIRGTVSAGGNIIHGSGFTVVHPGTGDYNITFTTPFAKTPSVTATVEYVDGHSVPRWPATDIVSPSSANIVIRYYSDGDQNGFNDYEFSFIAVGPR